MWTVENGRKSIKFKTMTSHVSRGLFPGFALVFVTCAESSTYVTTCNSIVFERFRPLTLRIKSTDNNKKEL